MAPRAQPKPSPLVIREPTEAELDALPDLAAVVETPSGSRVARVTSSGFVILAMPPMFEEANGKAGFLAGLGLEDLGWKLTPGEGKNVFRLEQAAPE